MKSRLGAFLQNTFVQGGIFLVLSNFLIGFLNYFFNLLAGRALGPTGYSEITALFSYITIFAVPVTVITSLIIKKIGSAGGNGQTYAQALEDWVFSKMKTWWFGSILLFFIIPLIPKLTNLSPFSGYMLVPLLILAFFAAFYDSILQGLHFFMWFALITLITAIVKLMGAGITYFTLHEVWIILVFILLAGVIQVISSKVIFNIFVYKKNKEKLFINKRIIHLLQNKELINTTISILAITLLNNADIIFVKKYFSAHEAGIYASWSLFAKIIFYVIGPLLSISFVFFSSKRHEVFHKRALVYSVILLVVFGIISYIGYKYLGNFIVLALLGEKFKGIVPYLTLASIFGTLYVAVSYLNNYFIAKGSNQALVIPVFIPFYIGFLFFIGKNIQIVMILNICFALSILCAYSVSYIMRIKKETINHSR